MFRRTILIYTSCIISAWFAFYPVYTLHVPGLEVKRGLTQPTPLPGIDCHDLISHCMNYIRYDPTICHADSPYRPWAEVRCRASCRICDGAPTTVAPECKDQLAYCGNFDIPAACNQYPDWAAENCRVTCGVCNPNQPGSIG